MMPVTNAPSSAPSSSSFKYDPMYCLSEHLDYFSTSVVGQLNLMECDFDDIFGNMDNLDLVNTKEVLPPPTKKTKLTMDTSSSMPTINTIAMASCPPSPKKWAPSSPSYSVVSNDIASVFPSNSSSQDQSQSDCRLLTDSPTTVTSTAVFVSPIAPKPVAIQSAVVATVTAAFPMPLVKKQVVVKKTVTATKKRKISDAGSDSASEPSSLSAPLPKSKGPKSPVEREECRRERNRQHAKRSRDRKREFFTALEQSVSELKAENEKMLEVLCLSSEESGLVVERENELQAASTENFIALLSSPENRVLTDDGLTALREHFQA